MGGRAGWSCGQSGWVRPGYCSPKLALITLAPGVQQGGPERGEGVLPRFQCRPGTALIPHWVGTQDPCPCALTARKADVETPPPPPMKHLGNLGSRVALFPAPFPRQPELSAQPRRLKKSGPSPLRARAPGPPSAVPPSRWPDSPEARRAVRAAAEPCAPAVASARAP